MREYIVTNLYTRSNTHTHTQTYGDNRRKGLVLLGNTTTTKKNNPTNRFNPFISSGKIGPLTAQPQGMGEGGAWRQRDAWVTKRKNNPISPPPFVIPSEGWCRAWHVEDACKWLERLASECSPKMFPESPQTVSAMLHHTSTAAHAFLPVWPYTQSLLTMSVHKTQTPTTFLPGPSLPRNGPDGAELSVATKVLGEKTWCWFGSFIKREARNAHIPLLRVSVCLPLSTPFFILPLLSLEWNEVCCHRLVGSLPNCEGWRFASRFVGFGFWFFDLLLAGLGLIWRICGWYEKDTHRHTHTHLGENNNHRRQTLVFL